VIWGFSHFIPPFDRECPANYQARGREPEHCRQTPGNTSRMAPGPVTINFGAVEHGVGVLGGLRLINALSDFNIQVVQRFFAI